MFNFKFIYISIYFKKITIINCTTQKELRRGFFGRMSLTLWLSRKEANLYICGFTVLNRVMMYGLEALSIYWTNSNRIGSSGTSHSESILPSWMWWEIVWYGDFTIHRREYKSFCLVSTGFEKKKSMAVVISICKLNRKELWFP